MAVIQEAYIHGVSTCPVYDLVKAMGAGGMFKSRAGRLCAEIDERVNAFLSRPLEDAWRAPGVQRHPPAVPHPLDEECPGPGSGQEPHRRRRDAENDSA